MNGEVKRIGLAQYLQGTPRKTVWTWATFMVRSKIEITGECKVTKCTLHVDSQCSLAWPIVAHNLPFEPPCEAILECLMPSGVGFARLIRTKFDSTFTTPRMLFPLHDGILLPALWASVADRELPALRFVHVDSRSR